MTRAILFDLDGTLLDHDLAAARAVVRWAEELGVDGEARDLVARWGELERFWFAAYERGELSHPGQRVERARGFLGQPSLGADTALSIYARYLELYRQNWTAFADAAPALRRALATGVPVGILTNGRREMQEQKLLATGLNFRELTLLPTVDMTAPKPDRRAFLEALTAVGAKQAVMIGDNPVTDIRGALDAGLQAVLLNRSGAPDHDVPVEVPVVQSLEQIDFDRLAAQGASR